MKRPDKLAEENIALLVGTEVLNFYLNEISCNLRTMTAQADVLETVILEMKEAAVQTQRAGAANGEFQ